MHTTARARSNSSPKSTLASKYLQKLDIIRFDRRQASSPGPKRNVDSLPVHSISRASGARGGQTRQLITSASSLSPFPYPPPPSLSRHRMTNHKTKHFFTCMHTPRHATSRHFIPYMFIHSTLSTRPPLRAQSISYNSASLRVKLSMKAAEPERKRQRQKADPSVLLQRLECRPCPGNTRRMVAKSNVLLQEYDTKQPSVALH